MATMKNFTRLILTKNVSTLNNEKFFKNFNKEDSFYFVHSYYAKSPEKNCILASYKFGGHLIPSIVAKDNIIGCQFHPEKSGPSGLNIIRNFISIWIFLKKLTNTILLLV